MLSCAQRDALQICGVGRLSESSLGKAIHRRKDSTHDRENAKGVGMPQTTLPTLDSNDGATRLDDLERKSGTHTEPNTIVDLRGYCKYTTFDSNTEGDAYISLPVLIRDAARLRVPERIAAAVQVHLPSGLLIPCDCDADD